MNSTGCSVKGKLYRKVIVFLCASHKHIETQIKNATPLTNGEKYLGANLENGL